MYQIMAREFTTAQKIKKLEVEVDFLFKRTELLGRAQTKYDRDLERVLRAQEKVESNNKKWETKVYKKVEVEKRNVA